MSQTILPDPEQATVVNTVTTDPSDRSARLLGHVTVDSAPAVTGTTTANQGTANATPWNENISQVNGTAVGRAQLPVFVSFGNGSGVATEVGFGTGQDKFPVQLSGLVNTVLTTASFALPVVLSPNLPTTGNTKEVRSGTGGTPFAVAITATSAAILAANANRLGAIIRADGSQPIYVGYGVTPTTTSYGDYIPPGGRLEVPFGITTAINGISGATGTTARGQELTA